MPFWFNIMCLVNLCACFVNFVVNYWPRMKRIFNRTYITLNALDGLLLCEPRACFMNFVVNYWPRMPRIKRMKRIFNRMSCPEISLHKNVNL